MATIYKSKLLIPNLPTNYFKKEDAQQKLGKVQANLVLVKAPYGYGKTSIIASWSIQQNNVCWYSIDENDNNLPHFLNYIIHSVRMVYPKFSVENEDDLPKINDLDTLCMLLSNALIDLGEKLVLVLDNYHFIKSPQVHLFISKLLKLKLPAFTIIVSSIKSLPLDYSFIKGSDLFVEITENDLKFSRREVKHYLQTQDIDDTFLAKYQYIYSTTRGAIWLLNLLNTSFKGAFTKKQYLSNLKHVISELLLAKVNDFTREERSMLCLLFSLPYFNEDIFNRLRNQNNLLSINYDDFVFLLVKSHYLIAENTNGENKINSLIQTNLSLKDIQRNAVYVKQSYTTLAEWCVENKLIKDAIFFYIKSENTDTAIELFKTLRQKVVAEGEWPVLAEVLNMFQPNEIQQNNLLKLSYIWVALSSGDTDGMRKELESISADDFKNEPNLLGEYFLFMSYYHLHFSFNMKKWELFGQKAIENIDNNNHYPLGLAWLFRCGALQAQGNTAKGVKLITSSITNSNNPIVMTHQIITLCYIHFIEANMVDLLSASNQLYRIGNETGREEVVFNAHYFLGISHFNLLDKSKAIEHLTCCYLDSSDNIVPHRYFAMVALLISKIDILSIDELIEMLDDINEVTIGRGEIRFYKYSKALTSLVYWRKQKDSSALAWARKAKYKPFLPMTFFISIPIVQAYILMGSDLKDQEIAMGIIKDILLYTEEVNNVQFNNQARLLEAILHQKMGFPEQATNSLMQLTDTLTEKGAKLSFIVLDETIASTLSAIEIDSKHKSFISSQLQFSMDDSKEESLKKESLTDREIEIFKLIKKNIANKEIGEKLFISEKTVKRHISNIYKKIGASNRSEAIELSKDRKFK